MGPDVCYYASSTSPDPQKPAAGALDPKSRPSKRGIPHAQDSMLKHLLKPSTACTSCTYAQTLAEALNSLHKLHLSTQQAGLASEASHTHKKYAQTLAEALKSMHQLQHSAQKACLACEVRHMFATIHQSCSLEPPTAFSSCSTQPERRPLLGIQVAAEALTQHAGQLSA